MPGREMFVIRECNSAHSLTAKLGGGQAHETEYPLFLAKWAWALMGIDGHGQKI